MSEFEPQEAKMSIRLLDKTFQIKCRSEQIESLQKAADSLDVEMRKMRESGVVGVDRIAIITALNLAHELNVSNERSRRFSADFMEKIRSLDIKIADALSHGEQLEVPLGE